MNEITDIWFKTNLRLDVLTRKLGFVLEEYDCENVWEWTISSFADVKIDICRDSTMKRSETFTDIFRIDEHKKPFSDELINYIVSKLKSINVVPIYLGKLWIGKEESFEYEIIKTIE
jgi:hypothetical protein